MDVAVWLKAIGLGAYRELLQVNAIDAGVLAELTDDDREKLGLPPGATARSS